jgi:hypothetical protein
MSSYATLADAQGMGTILNDDASRTTWGDFYAPRDGSADAALLRPGAGVWTFKDSNTGNTSTFWSISRRRDHRHPGPRGLHRGWHHRLRRLSPGHGPVGDRPRLRADGPLTPLHGARTRATYRCRPITTAMAAPSTSIFESTVRSLNDKEKRALRMRLASLRAHWSRLRWRLVAVVFGLCAVLTAVKAMAGNVSWATAFTFGLATSLLIGVWIWVEEFVRRRKRLRQIESALRGGR